jgi:hypothetical protein
VYVIPATLDNAMQGELQRYKNNYNVINFITTALDRNVYDRVLIYKLHTMSGLNCAIPIRGLLRLSLYVGILIIGSTKLSLRNLVNLWMIVLLVLNPLPVAYILVVLLNTMIMNMLSSCYMRLMIIFGA